MLALTSLFELKKLTQSTTPLNITPKVGVGKIKFGMTKDQVKRICPGAEEFKKTPASKYLTLDCKSFHVYFNNNGKCDEIEAFEESNISYNGYRFFVKSLSEDIAFLKKQDPSTITKGDSTDSKKLGIKLWTIDGKILETVLVYK
jgi:hypothetical protein